MEFRVRTSELPEEGLALETLRVLAPVVEGLPKGPKVVPFWGSYLESYKVLPKRNYYGASG